ncbi:hypothetical protein [Viridibacillus arvi]|uniref:hypothetical protein n=1 Tax=Viridibacillus arvi TaxID=263475 RepID=UPI0034CD30E6
MADIKNLEERVVKAEVKVEKCKGTIERHKKQYEKKVQALIKKGVDLTGLSKEEIDKVQDGYRQTELNWDIYDVKGKLEDIKGATKKLEEAEQILVNWNDKLSIEINKDKFIQDNAPQVIKDFLEDWKKKAYEWHIRRYDAYQEFKEELRSERNNLIIEFVKANPEVAERYLDENGNIQDYWQKDLINIRLKGLESHLKENELDYRSIESRKSNFAGGNILKMDSMYDEKERLNWLDKTLEREKKAKMLDLIHRISKVVGEITDASSLRISGKGSIDGFVIGDKGKAKVNTIDAGGWNIQCWHYRTLVDPVK